MPCAHARRTAGAEYLIDVGCWARGADMGGQIPYAHVHAGGRTSAEGSLWKCGEL
jgi:hypothetical protein